MTAQPPSVNNSAEPGPLSYQGDVQPNYFGLPEHLPPAPKYKGSGSLASPNPRRQPADPVAASERLFEGRVEAASDETASDGQTTTSAGEIRFPELAIVGSLGEAARELARGREVPVEFIYAGLLTILGIHCSGRLTLNIGMKHDTRLYTVLYGESGDTKKSSALETAVAFFESLGNFPESPQIVEGLGSAEGLMRAFDDNKRVLLTYDELRSLVDKTKIAGSVLLSAITALFEHDSYENYTKDRALSVKNAKLGLIGCATAGTYESMWTPEAIDIGLLNRLFLVGGVRQPKVLFPGQRDRASLCATRDRLRNQLARLPLMLSIETEAAAELDDWYRSLEPEPQTKRLDTILRSLLPLVALTTDKSCIDLETARIVRTIVEYEFRIRQIADPVDADGPIAKLEEKISSPWCKSGFRNGKELCDSQG